MLGQVRFGFGEHGHLVGRPCTTGIFDPAGDPVESVSASTDLPFVLMVRDRSLCLKYAESLVAVYRSLTAAGYKVYACVRPGVQLRDNLLAYDAVVRVLDSDDFGHPPECDDRYASVSVHCWPGSHVMTRLSRLVADRGKYLFVTGDDLGQAKLWLRCDPAAQAAGWVLSPGCTLNDSLEPAEICEMYVRTR